VLGADNLLLVSAALFGLALACMSRVVRTANPEISAERQAEAERAMGGSILEGLYLVLRSPYLLGICLLMLLTTSMATFLYFQQARIVSELFTSSEQRTAVFGAIDLAVNISALTLQIFGTNRLVRRLGVPAAIALVPVLMVLVFVGLGVAPVLSMLVIAQVIRRGGNYGLMRPCREMLFTVVGRRAKYKAKNFIDTVVYRGGDAVSAWVYAGLAALGLGVGQTALVAAPVAGLWAVIAWRLGRSLESHEDGPPGGSVEPEVAAGGPRD
jgi:AAA family ATP:ADP antiporter